MFVPSNAIPAGLLPTVYVPSVAPVGDCAVARTLLQTPGFRDARGARGATQSFAPVEDAPDEDAPPAPAAPDEGEPDEGAPREEGFELDDWADGESTLVPHATLMAMATQYAKPPGDDIPAF
jgi:hypothetical protein